MIFGESLYAKIEKKFNWRLVTPASFEAAWVFPGGFLHFWPEINARNPVHSPNHAPPLPSRLIPQRHRARPELQPAHKL
jgi:hypothetical protein